MNPHVLKIGEPLDRTSFSELMKTLNYAKSQHVHHPGDYAIRGNTYDIFPVTYRSPMRLEVRISKIHSIRDFSPLDGKSMTLFEEVFLLPVSEIFEKKAKRLRERFENFEALTEVTDLSAGDIVVHAEYGIGRYLGTKMLEIKGKGKRHIALEFAKGEILYLDLKEPIERYIGGEGHSPRLTKLHTKEWEKVKQKTKRAIRHVAKDLLELQAKRSLGKGFSYPKDQPWQKEFESEFPFQETEDQLKALKEVKSDLESKRPMDRLLCGDVGYGKTEVAMRAAFKAVLGGKQVAMLVPTTVLAEQHYLVLKERVKNFPVTVEVLSRFRPKSEQEGIVKKVKEGSVDIIIGTHRLLSKDVAFNELGLVIIDEEQRFGVRHKERLKHMRSLVDVLTLTATPIPRTLYLSMMGSKDMSIISTPPKSRLPIETCVMEYNELRIQEAIEFEIKRGGQIYFVHNRVQSIEKVAKTLQELLPKVKFGIAHGQMSARHLEKVMSEFMNHDIDCLVTTSIIESGIDIPNVNTIIINRADAFGLSDLYQLRGRVGRFHEKRQAYAYFMVPKNWILTQDAEKRLAAIEKFTELGSGFKIALEDLEIRGSGNLLGHEQSGFIHAVGFDLYCRMLREAIEEHKAQKSS